MKKKSIALGMTIVLCVTALVISSASAAGAFHPGPGADRGLHLTGLLEKLEDEGYDMSAIRSAIANGDHKTARTLMQQFMEQHRDELPTPPCGEGKGMHRSWRMEHARCMNKHLRMAGEYSGTPIHGDWEERMRVMDYQSPQKSLLFPHFLSIPNHMLPHIHGMKNTINLVI